MPLYWALHLVRYALQFVRINAPSMEFVMRLHVLVFVKHFGCHHWDISGDLEMPIAVCFTFLYIGSIIYILLNYRLVHFVCFCVHYSNVCHVNWNFLEHCLFLSTTEDQDKNKSQKTKGAKVFSHRHTG